MEQQSELTAEAERTWDRPAVMLPIFLLLSAAGGLFPSFTVASNLYVLAIGGTLFWLGLSGRVPRRPAPRRLPRGTVWWVVPALTLSVIELTTFVAGSTNDYPTLSLLADPVLETYLARAALYFGWLTGFWGLVRR
jgi:hypothetical protein